MKKLFTVFLSIALLISGCSANGKKDQSDGISDNSSKESENTSSEAIYTNLDDEDFHQYLKDKIYYEVVNQLEDSEYYVDGIDVQYVSKEYLEESEYNAKENIFFGYNLEEVESEFSDQKYVFTLEDNETVVQEFVDYDTTYDEIVKNVVIGSGIILICVTASTVTGGAGMPAISMVFTVSAKTGAVMAITGGTLDGIISGTVKAIETNGDVKESLKAAALGASDGFKFGAISGTITGGLQEWALLKGLSKANPFLSIDEIATIQKESNLPYEVIAKIETMEEYNVLKDAGLETGFINGKASLIRDIDLNQTDELGRTNLERMKKGLAALDSDGNSYELHHIGQSMDSPLAILTEKEHDKIPNLIDESQIDRSIFKKQREKFWKTLAKMVMEE